MPLIIRNSLSSLRMYAWLCACRYVSMTVYIILHVQFDGIIFTGNNVVPYKCRIFFHYDYRLHLNATM